MIGKKIRINRLKNTKGFYFFLALDHQLSVGHKDSIHNIDKWIEYVNGSESISGIVLNYGSLKKLPAHFRKTIVPQLIGAPSLFGKYKKTQTIKIESALKYSSDLFSLQINFQIDDNLEQFNLICDLINRCDSLNIPTMLMINLNSESDFTTKRFIDYIKYCDEIGVDFIKTPLPNDVENNIEYLKSVVTDRYNLLLAGGGQTNDFINNCQIAKQIGYKGLCVGRNVFENDEPTKINEQICKIFKT